MKLGLAFVLALLFFPGTFAGVAAQDFQLLAFSCLDLEVGGPLALQFERETFPPFTDTGLFAADTPQLLYVEQGRLTIFSDQLGQARADNGFVYLATPGEALGVRNDDLVDGSLLWLRLTDPLNYSQATRFAAPGALDSLRPKDPAYVDPLFVEIELPPIPEEPAYLFIGRMEVGPNASLDLTSEEMLLTTTGAAALTVEGGTLQVTSLSTQSLGLGDALVIDGNGVLVENPYAEPATAFLFGLIPHGDTGQVRAAIELDMDQLHTCPSS